MDCFTVRHFALLFCKAICWCLPFTNDNPWMTANPLLFSLFSLFSFLFSFISFLCSLSSLSSFLFLSFLSSLSLSSLFSLLFLSFLNKQFATKLENLKRNLDKEVTLPLKGCEIQQLRVY